MLHRLTHDGRKALLLAQAEASLLENEWVNSTHILLGLLDGNGGTVANALRAAGIETADLRRAAGLPEQRETTGSLGKSVQLSEDAQRVLRTAELEAARLRHVNIEPGHLLLAILSEPTAPGYKLLSRLKADPQPIQVELLRRLPTVPDDLRRLEQASARLVAPTPAETDRLVNDVRTWQRASEQLSEMDQQLPPAESARLNEVRTATSSAWLELYERHLGLAWSMAGSYAKQESDLAYAYMIACQCLAAASISSPRSHPGRFAEFARSHMEQCLQSEVGEAGAPHVRQ